MLMKYQRFNTQKLLPSFLSCIQFNPCGVKVCLDEMASPRLAAGFEVCGIFTDIFTNKSLSLRTYTYFCILLNIIRFTSLTSVFLANLFRSFCAIYWKQGDWISPQKWVFNCALIYSNWQTWRSSQRPGRLYNTVQNFILKSPHSSMRSDTTR